MTADEREFINVKFEHVGQTITALDTRMERGFTELKQAAEIHRAEASRALEKSNSRIDTIERWIVSGMGVSLAGAAAALWAWISGGKSPSH